MMKVVSFTFYKGLGPSNMSTLKGFPKQCFLKSNLTKSFTACKFRNKKAMTIIFFSKMFEI